MNDIIQKEVKALLIIFKISLLLSLIIFMILIIRDSGIQPEDHEG